MTEYEYDFICKTSVYSVETISPEGRMPSHAHHPGIQYIFNHNNPHSLTWKTR